MVKPAVALDRLSYDAATCRVTVNSTKQMAQRELTALDFMADLAVRVPDHGEHTVRYYGRATNRARGERKKALAQAPDTLACTPPLASPETEQARPRGRKAFRPAWAALLKRVWDIDAFTVSCVQWRHAYPVRIQNTGTIVRILTHLGLSTKAVGP